MVTVPVRNKGVTPVITKDGQLLGKVLTWLKPKYSTEYQLKGICKGKGIQRFSYHYDNESFCYVVNPLTLRTLKLRSWRPKNGVCYHVTARSNLESIRQEGLIPQPMIYLGASIDLVKSIFFQQCEYGHRELEQLAVLRVKLPMGHPLELDTNTESGAWKTPLTIPPKQIKCVYISEPVVRVKLGADAPF